MASAAEQLAANINFGAIAKAEELKKRIWFTLGALIVYRLGTYIPLPGINPESLRQSFQNASGGMLGRSTSRARNSSRSPADIGWSPPGMSSNVSSATA